MPLSDCRGGFGVVPHALIGVDQTEMLPPGVRFGTLVTQDGRHVSSHGATITTRFIAKTTDREFGLIDTLLVGAAPLVFPPTAAWTRFVASDFLGPCRCYRIHRSLEIGNVLPLIGLDAGDALLAAHRTLHSDGVGALLGFYAHDNRTLFGSEFCHEIGSRYTPVITITAIPDPPGQGCESIPRWPRQWRRQDRAWCFAAPALSPPPCLGQ